MPKSRYTRDKERGGYRFNFKQANGKYTTLRAATVPEMDALIRKKIKERDALLAPPMPKSITVEEVAEPWFRIASDGLALNGKNSLENSLRHVLNAFGPRPINSITPSDIDEMILNLPGNSDSLRKKVLTVMKRLFQYALDNNYVRRDPTAMKKTNGDKPREVAPLTPEQQRILLQAVSNTSAYIFCLLMLRTGLRPEEARGLKWDAVDLKAGFLSVEQTVIFDGNAPVVSRELKTAAARRRLPIPRDLAEALREEKAYSTQAYVMPGSRGPMSRQEYQNMWKLVKNRTRKPEDPLCNRNCKLERHITFPVHPYQLRHTYITELCAHSAETGLDIKTIQYLAGHSNPQITLNIYAHVMAGRQEDTAQKVQAIFDLSSPEISPEK